MTRLDSRVHFHVYIRNKKQCMYRQTYKCWDKQDIAHLIEWDYCCFFFVPTPSLNNLQPQNLVSMLSPTPPSAATSTTTASSHSSRKFLAHVHTYRTAGATVDRVQAGVCIIASSELQSRLAGSYICTRRGQVAAQYMHKRRPGVEYQRVE